MVVDIGDQDRTEKVLEAGLGFLNDPPGGRGVRVLTGSRMATGAGPQTQVGPRARTFRRGRTDGNV